MRQAARLDHQERLTTGDPKIAEALLGALRHADEVERGTHGFHTYPAGLHPDAARDLVRLFPARRLLDPFCGGGTVLVEGRIAGLETEGRDLSQVAVRVARARTSTPSDELLTELRSHARRMTAAARGKLEEPPEWIREALGQWYADFVLAELWALRTQIAEVEGPTRAWLEVIFSSIVVKTSWRNSDTSAKRVKHRRPEGTAPVLFHKKARELARRMVALRELVPEGTPETRLDLQDARQLRVRPKVDLVVTSPPYPSTYDYLPLQHIRRVWLGDVEAEAIDREIGSRRSWRQEGAKQARRVWAEDTKTWTRSMAAALEDGGHAIIVIGDGLHPAGVVDTVEPTVTALRAAGLREVGRASVARPDHARGTVRWEHIIASQKDPAT
ncbi:MAG: hypothetical protein JXX28_10340 [Deltaproteobacteria bacterium]|nr:hypothetical protein [Deltaproteobacteria bacterium]